MDDQRCPLKVPSILTGVVIFQCLVLPIMYENMAVCGHPVNFESKSLHGSVNFHRTAKIALFIQYKTVSAIKYFLDLNKRIGYLNPMFIFVRR